MDMILSLQALETDVAARDNSGASVACTSGSAVSYNCGGQQTKLEQ